eukprot:m.719450 g.719450  ORF g.719450 m.719450 type:complete len:67 (-) comp23001_c0_seq6:842-1042(-)
MSRKRSIAHKVVPHRSSAYAISSHVCATNRNRENIAHVQQHTMCLTAARKVITSPASHIMVTKHAL